jgi:hydroxymethylbilane synthase
MQSQGILDALKKCHPGLQIELVLIQTTGDRITDKPLHDAGGKGLFTKEIEQALLANEIDIAVHSYKDVPVTMPLVDQAELIIAAVPAREDPRDVLVSATTRHIADLPQNARIGTGSLRRRCQMLAIRPDLQLELIRGNIDTRLRKLRSGEFDAIVLALAGLRRSGLFNETEMTPIEADQMLPAAGQGAIALQCRQADMRTREVLSSLHSPPDAACADLERAVVQALGGDCHSPIAALATIANNQFTLRAAVGARDGAPPVISTQACGSAENSAAILQQVLSSLKQQGADRLLRPGIAG